MSSVDCEQCGAHYDQWGDIESGTATDTPVVGRCAHCGAELSAKSPEARIARPGESAEREERTQQVEDQPQASSEEKDASSVEISSSAEVASEAGSGPSEELLQEAPSKPEISENDEALQARVEAALMASKTEEENGRASSSEKLVQAVPTEAGEIVSFRADDPGLLDAELGDEANTRVELTPSSQVTLEPAPVSEIPLESSDFIGETRRARRAPDRMEPTPAPRTTLQEEAPNSLGTPTLAALVARKEKAAGRTQPELFPDLEPRDHRPPDIRVEESPHERVLTNAAPNASISALLRTPKSDAPVARPSREPEARSSSLGTLLLFGMLLAAGAVLFVRFSTTDRVPEPSSFPSESPGNRQQATQPRLALDPPQASAAAHGTMDAERSPEHSALESTLSPDPPPRAADSAAQLDQAPSSLKKVVAKNPRSTPEMDEPAAVPSEVPVQPALAPFDATAAGAALELAAQRANGCRKPGDLSGEAVVILTFAPSGKVTSANVSGAPFAGTETGGCIASTLREARVPPFSGEYITVKKTVLIQ